MVSSELVASITREPSKRISSAASLAQPGDTVLVAGGLYRERVAPANSGREDVVITASNVLKWTTSKDDGGSFVAQLDDSLFDTLDGTPKGKLQSGVGCNALTTGQVYIDGDPLAEIGLASLHKC